LIFWYQKFMKRSIKKDTQKSRGRPATGVGIQIGTRWPPDIVHMVDEWRRQHPDLPGRPEAIRRLVELGLKVKTEAKPVRKPGRRLGAQELAAKAIEGIVDPAAPPEERAQRRRRLTKGPLEFRDDRVDQPKAKRR
jgi:hypothetical protein